MKQSKEEVFERFAGANGVKDQLAVFSGLWEVATSYVRTVHQSAVGGLSVVENSGTGSNELMAVALTSGDVLVWFERCQEELTRLQARGEITELPAEPTESKDALQRSIH